jgi:hypothetical protein
MSSAFQQQIVDILSEEGSLVGLVRLCKRKDVVKYSKVVPCIINFMRVKNITIVVDRFNTEKSGCIKVILLIGEEIYWQSAADRYINSFYGETNIEKVIDLLKQW